ncbi:MAG: FecR family protein [Proteobacteria bacterium]|nr:FecR family protein [Pseudomonadota bacterium]
MRTGIVSIFCVSILFLFALSLGADDSSPQAKAKIKALEGEASYSLDGKTFSPVKSGGEIPAGAIVKTGPNARLELGLPDGSFLRMSGNSQMKLNAVEYQQEAKSRDFKFHLDLGKIWAKARDISERGSRFEVETATAVTGVRGTVFRINVDPDRAMIVKVYQGSILLRSPREVFRPAGAGETRKEIAGPREVAPPDEIGRAEWELLVKAMQEVRVSPDGKASRPKDFTLEEDLDDWVKWNLERDKSSAPEPQENPAK